MKRHAKALVAFVIACLTIGAGTAFALNGHVPSPSNPFLTGLANPQALAVDQSNGDLYVLDVGDSSVKRFDSSGAPANFSALAGNAINGSDDGVADPDATPQGGFSFDSPSNSQIAIDRSGGPADGYLYVTNAFNGVVNVFDNTGTYKGRLPNTGGEPCGVAVDPFGSVYVANAGTAKVYRYAPAADPADAVSEGQLQLLFGPCAIAADAGANVYLVPQFGGQVFKYEGSQFGQSNPTSTEVAPSATALYLDPATEDLYVDEGNRIAHYSSAGSLIQRFGSSELAESAGVAIDSGSAVVYGSDSSDGTVAAFVPAILPDAATAAATAVTDTTATLNGTVDPAGGPEADCEFRWGTDDTYGNTAPCTPAGPYSEATAASAELTGLTPGTVYHFQVVGSNAEGATPGADRTFTTVGAPIVSGLSASDVGTGSATLHGTIDPAGSETSYRFEYVSEADFEANEFTNATSAPVPDGSVEAGPAEEVTQEIDGLEEATAYRYRLTATNEATTTSGDRRLTTHVPAGEFELPEGRRWEMVSPVDKNGVDVRIDFGRTRALDNGDKIAFTALRPFGDAQGSSITTEFMAMRAASGWQTHSIMPAIGPQNSALTVNQFTARYAGELSADGTTGVFASHEALTDESENAPNLRKLYLRRDLDKPGTGSYELLSNPTVPLSKPQVYEPSPANIYGLAYAGASEDFSHVVIGSVANLTGDYDPLLNPGGAPEQPTQCLDQLKLFRCEPRLFEHTAAGLRLVGMVPPGSATSCSGAECVPAVRSVGRHPSGVALPRWVISKDGSRIFFTEADTTLRRGNLFVREDGTTTYKVNVSENPSLPTPPNDAKFWNTSADGSKAFFTTAGQLLEEDTDNDADVYRYDLDAPEGSRLTLISVDGEPDDGATDADAVYGASEDGEYVYFTSTSQLVEGEPLREGGRNYVFLWHAGEVRFVGPVGNSKLDENNKGDHWVSEPRQARVTPDGSHLLFVSRVANDDAAVCEKTPSGDTSCARAYVYDADANDGAGKLHCASCPPDGSPAKSDANWTPKIATGGSSSEGHLNQALTDDGRFAFFSTADSLVPEDSNGRYDAYAYDTVAGKPRLLSSGACNCDSWFIEASPDGSDVFFITRQQLVGWDTDNLNDLYDARVGGGFPEPPPPPPTCTGDACQPPPVALNDPTPASSAFAGVGNEKGRRPSSHCPQGKHRVKSHGKSRCVKNKAKKKNKQNRADHDRRASR